MRTALVALVFAAIGAGTAVGVMLWEPWDGGDGVERAEQQSSPTETGPTRAELDAQRDDAQRENDRLCLEAQQANAAAEAAYYQKAASGGLGVFQQAAFDSGLGGYGTSPSIQGQIDRYC